MTHRVFTPLTLPTVDTIRFHWGFCQLCQQPPYLCQHLTRLERAMATGPGAASSDVTPTIPVASALHRSLWDLSYRSAYQRVGKPIFLRDFHFWKLGCCLVFFSMVDDLTCRRLRTLRS